MAFYGPRLYGAVFWAPLELISSWMLASRTRVGQFIDEKNLSFIDIIVKLKKLIYCRHKTILDEYLYQIDWLTCSDCASSVKLRQ